MQGREVISLDTSDVEMMKQWKEMHLEWLCGNKLLEPADEIVLNNPKKYITDRGGRLYGIVNLGQLIGTVCIRPESEGRWEMLKLAVHKNHRRNGIALLLVNNAIEFCRFEMKGKGLDEGIVFLDTASKLSAAVGLYRKFGFATAIQSSDKEIQYETADLYLELKINLIE